MWIDVNQTYSTAGAQNCWANLKDKGWRQVKAGSDDGVTNVHLLLVLANANAKKAYVVEDGANQITAVYL